MSFATSLPAINLAFCLIFFCFCFSVTLYFLFFENPAKKRCHASVANGGCISCQSMASMFRDSTVVVVVVVRTRPRAIPLAMIIIRKSVFRFPSALLSIYGMGLRLRLAAFGRQSSAITWGIVDHPVVDMLRGKWNIS